MKACRWWVVIASMAFINTFDSAYAQKAYEGRALFGFQFQGRHQSVRIPFELHSNLILVPVVVNRMDTLKFILDTGVSSTIVTNPEALKVSPLLLTRKVLLTGVGEGQPISAHVAINNVLEVGGLQAYHQNLVVLDEDFLDLSEYVGAPVHGIFGYEVFNNFVVTIDFTHRELVIMKPDRYRYRTRKGDKYPITIEDAKPFTSAVTLLADGREQSIKVAIDTGAGHALLLDKSSDGSIGLPDKVIRAQLGRGLSGVINGSLGRIQSVRLGRYELENVVASFPDSLAFGSKLSATDSRHGNIGCELLRRFKVTINYQGNYMVLKPVKRRMREKFEHDMSGIEIRAEGKDLKTYLVSHVLENSPAYKAGLLEGDVLLFMNDRPMAEMNISDIYKLLQKGDGKAIGVLVRRNGAFIFTQITLKRMI